MSEYYSIQQPSDKQFCITLPAVFVRTLKWSKGDKVKFVLGRDGSSMTLIKV